MTESPHDPRLVPLLAGLVDVANAGCADVELFERMCAGVRDAGVPLVRSALQMENLHPVYYGYCLHWQDGGTAHLLERSRTFGASEEFRRSQYMPRPPVVAGAGGGRTGCPSCRWCGAAAIKETLRRTEGLPFQVALDLVTRKQLPTVRRLYESDDQLEGARAFAEKCKPVWRGR